MELGQMQFRFLAIVLCCILIASALIYRSALSFDPAEGQSLILIPHRSLHRSGTQSLPEPNFNYPVSESIIRGQVAYIPTDKPNQRLQVKSLYVCAEPALKGKTFCTKSFTSGTDGMKTYELYVTPGDYYVYAAAPDIFSYRAYYDNYVICGLKKDCVANPAKLISVASGQSINNIFPLDWFQP